MVNKTILTTLDTPSSLIALLIPAALYAALGAHFWITRWQQNATPPSQMRTWERMAIGAALLGHGVSLNNEMHQADGVHFSFALALSLMMWLAALIYWLESFKARMEGLQPMVLPITALSVLLPALFPQTHLVANLDDLGFRLHFLSAMLAYSLFTLAALHAIFMGYVERKLHHRELSRRIISLPPLMTMETLLFRVLTVGFTLLTLTLGSGLIYAEEIFGRALQIDHKTIFAILSWLVFATLLVGRLIYGWRGRIALRWTLIGFGTLLLAYVGSRFVLEIILARP